MQPNQPPQPPVQPPFTPESTTGTPAPVNGRKRTTLALWLMIGPTALIIISILLYAVANLAFSSTVSGGGDMFGQQGSLQIITNVILFIIGGISVLTWLPGFIIGIVLLATKKP